MTLAAFLDPPDAQTALGKPDQLRIDQNTITLIWTMPYEDITNSLTVLRRHYVPRLISFVCGRHTNPLLQSFSEEEGKGKAREKERATGETRVSLSFNRL